MSRFQLAAILVLAGSLISCKAEQRASSSGAPAVIETVAIESIDSLPLFTVGSDTEPFGRITSLLMLDSATLVVADGMGPRLTRHDVLSGATAVIGRSGNGPGEFRDICCLFQWDRAIIAAYDSRQRKLSLIGASGEFVASGDLIGEPLSILVPLSRFSNDSIVVRAERLPRPGVGAPGEVHRDTVDYALYSADVRRGSIDLRRGRGLAVGLGRMRYTPRD